jgi:signal transduction histidine kinase
MHRSGDDASPPDAMPRLCLLNHATSVLISSLDHRATLKSVAWLVVERFADACEIEILDADGALSPIEIAVRDPALLPIVMKARRADARPEAPQPEDPRRPKAPDAVDPEAPAPSRSVIRLDMCARGRRAGVLTMTSFGRPFDSYDLELAGALAGRCGAALENGLAYEEALRATRMRGELLAVVSHDLKNLLGVVQFTSDALQKQAPSPDLGAHRRQAERIKRASEQMDRLVRDLLDWSSADAVGLVIECNDHELGSLLDEVIEMFEPLANVKSISLGHCDRAVDGEATWVHCDRGRVLQVFANLIGNAIKFTPPGGAIRIRTSLVEGAVLIAVDDTGSGISKLELPHVFEGFWQGKAGSGQGVGLGLAIARSIVEAHGGAMWAESALAVGSTFSFTLPRVVRGPRIEDERAIPL